MGRKRKPRPLKKRKPPTLPWNRMNPLELYVSPTLKEKFHLPCKTIEYVRREK
jgi:hypothetical protein